MLEACLVPHRLASGRVLIATGAGFAFAVTALLMLLSLLPLLLLLLLLLQID